MSEVQSTHFVVSILAKFRSLRRFTSTSLVVTTCVVRSATAINISAGCVVNRSPVGSIFATVTASSVGMTSIEFVFCEVKSVKKIS